MTELPLYMTMATASLAGLAMLTTALLAGWRGWLALKREELSHAAPGMAAATVTPTAGARIEIADLKERIRKLEAIAAGVEL